MTDKKHRSIKPEPAPSDPVDPVEEALDGAPAAPAAPAAESTPLPGEPPDQAIARLGAELDALKDRHLRLAAEYDNYRKRTTKERAETWLRAQAELVQRLADALDDLSRFAHVDPAQTDAKTIHDGVDLVERKVWKELEAAGVTRVDQTGVPFDPAVHEAVTTQPAAAPEEDHSVGQVLQAGYKLRDLLLRPARVVVLTWQGERPADG